MKRVREGAGGDLEAEDGEGRAIPAQEIAKDVLLSQEALKIVLLQAGASATAKDAHVILGKLSKTSGLWDNFIKRTQLWKALFRRDFPDQFQYAVENDEKEWKIIKARLDQNSQQPFRQDTYWKRWYELLKRTDLRFKETGAVQTLTIPEIDKSTSDTWRSVEGNIPKPNSLQIYAHVDYTVKMDLNVPHRAGTLLPMFVDAMFVMPYYKSKEDTPAFDASC